MSNGITRTGPSAILPDDGESPGSSTSRAIDRAVRLLFTVAEAEDPLTLSELGRRSGLAKTTTFRLLGTLHEHHLVIREDNRYRLGPRLLGLISPRRQLPRPIYLPHLIDLHNATDLTVCLTVLRGAEIVHLDRVYGHNRIASPSDWTDRAPAHCTAAGKLLIAYRPTPVCWPLDAMTGATITTLSDLSRQLDGIRQAGIAYSRGELTPELGCMAVPVLGRTRAPIAALAVAGRDTHLDDETVEKRLRRTALSLSRAMRAAMHPHPTAALSQW
ncbi:IclR family transcriptional regulator [Nocardia sp. JMUB6875]|uniref:IclR family transcriptional regulator n=1 Tax=Nocardia sp. JMUB6875 TaxID=3158170 RepID=UPI0032E5D372